MMMVMIMMIIMMTILLRGMIQCYNVGNDNEIDVDNCGDDCYKDNEEEGDDDDKEYGDIDDGNYKGKFLW